MWGVPRQSQFEILALKWETDTANDEFPRCGYFCDGQQAGMLPCRYIEVQYWDEPIAWGRKTVGPGGKVT